MCIIIGNDQCPHVTLQLGSQPIDCVNGAVHLGTMLTASQAIENSAWAQKVSAGNRAFYASQGLGTCMVPLPVTTASKLYHSLSLPKILYGVEVMNVSNNSLAKMEHSQIKIAKSLQGLPSNCPNIIPLATLGWHSIQAHIDILRLNFLWRVLLLPMDNIIKKVVIFRLLAYLYGHFRDSMHGPTVLAVISAKKYDLLDIIKDAVLNGKYMSMLHWKKMVKNTVIQREVQNWKNHIIMYNNGSILSEILPDIKMWPWWFHLKYYPRRKKMCSRLLNLIKSYNVVATMCTLCSMYVPDRAHHVLFECDALKSIQDKQWSHVQQNAPRALIVSIEHMSHYKKFKFLSSGMDIPYTQEWSKMYDSILCYVFAVSEAKHLLLQT